MGVLTLAFVVLVATAALGAFDGSDRERVASRLQIYVKERVSDDRGFGPVVGTECVREHTLRFRGEKVFICDVGHRSGTIETWCAAVVDGVLYTKDRTRSLPCVTR